jgi:D-lactate dehydrogenase
MNVAVFNTKPYDRQFLEKSNQDYGHRLKFFDVRLTQETARLADGHEAICVFVNDVLDAPTLEILAAGGTRFIALRCAGFNNVDLHAAHRLGMPVARVPAYSPHAVAEHTVGLMLTLNRKFHRAYLRVREGNFSLNGLLGFDLRGRTAGIVGTGRIGQVVARILHGFDCRLLAHDVREDEGCRKLGVEYVDMNTLLAASDIVTLHCPLMPSTHHIIDAQALARMKTGVMLINTSRGGLIDTPAVIGALKSGKIGHLGIDVYEEEADLFFEDLSGEVIQDDVFARLVSFPNVLVTGHQAFLTAEALEKISTTTLANLRCLERGEPCENLVTLDSVRGT